MTDHAFFTRALAAATFLALTAACDGGASGHADEPKGGEPVAEVASTMDSVVEAPSPGGSPVHDEGAAGQAPIDLERPLYVIPKGGGRLAFLAGWPGASAGAPPPLTGTFVRLGTGTCEPFLQLLGEAAADSLGPQIEPLVPTARLSGDPRITYSSWIVGTLESACPGPESHGRAPPIDASIRTLLDSAAAGLQSILERRGVPGAQHPGVEVLEMPGGLQLWLTTEAVAPEDPRDRRNFFAGFAATPDSLTPIFLHETGPYTPWYAIGAVDVTGDLSPDVLASTWQMGDEETFGIAILKGGGSEWDLWREVSLFRVTPYGD